MRGKRAAGRRRYLPGGWADDVLPVNAALIAHPDGLCLFDAGQTSAATRSGYHPRWHPFHRLARFELGPADDVASQLAASGIAPADVRWVVLSHLHTDHIGGLRAFTTAEVVVSEEEWRRASGTAGRVRGYVPHRLPEGLAPRLVNLPAAPVGPFARSLDLAGDGLLTLVATPLHTPGHLSLLVRDGDLRVLCAGDAATSLSTLLRDAPDVAAWCRDEAVALLPAHGPLELGTATFAPELVTPVTR